MNKSYSESILTVVLTSRENFVWSSMQEIVPFIERAWLESASGNHEVIVIDVDSVSLRDHFQLLLRAQNVVLACFTHKICRYAAFLRTHVGFDARFIIYLHNQASIGCWPYFEWGLGDHLEERDCFIASCTRDRQAMDLVFHRHHVEVVPFGGFENLPGFNVRNVAETITRFIYVGRLSFQKNITTLIDAVSIFRGQNPDMNFCLDVYGSEDHLGNPNMGLESTNYLNELKDLVVNRNLQNHISFKGHLERSQLQAHLASVDHVFISASLHSDENFGMAAFYSLCLGRKAVLSNWGGHADFFDTFSSQVRLVDVYATPKGPRLEPADFAQKMEQVICDQVSEKLTNIPEKYRMDSISKKLNLIATQSCLNRDKLLPTELAKRIRENRRKFILDSPRLSKIFSSYEDPDAHQFFKAYGMKVHPGIN